MVVSPIYNVGVKTIVETIFADITNALPAVGERSFELLAADPVLAEQLEQVRLFGSQTLLECPPAELDALRKVGYFPFAEASAEIDYAIMMSLVGAYKLGYHALRSFLELTIVGIYYVSDASTEDDATGWLSGELVTPFMSVVRRKLLKLPAFAAAEANVKFDELLNDVYSRISDRTHTRGTPHAHAALSKSNRPRFVEATMRKFVADAREVCQVAAVALAIQRPILLISLPLWERFGLNPPMSGYLEAMESENLRSFIEPKRLLWLEEYASADENVRLVIDWIESRPDLTPEEIELQKRAHDEWLQSMASGTSEGETG